MRMPMCSGRASLAGSPLGQASIRPDTRSGKPMWTRNCRLPSCNCAKPASVWQPSSIPHSATERRRAARRLWIERAALATSAQRACQCCDQESPAACHRSETMEPAVDEVSCTHQRRPALCGVTPATVPSGSDGLCRGELPQRMANAVNARTSPIEFGSSASLER